MTCAKMATVSMQMSRGAMMRAGRRSLGVFRAMKIEISLAGGIIRLASPAQSRLSGSPEERRGVRANLSMETLSQMVAAAPPRRRSAACLRRLCRPACGATSSPATVLRVWRHAGLGRPAGHADTPLDDQQAMLGLHQTTNRPCWDSMLFYAIARQGRPLARRAV